MSIVSKPVGILEFLLGPAEAARIEAADAAASHRRTMAIRPADAREVRSHLGEAAETFEALAGADFDAPAPALPSMADWIETQAQAIRANRSELAWWLAERVDEIARECKFLRADTPDQFDDRADIMTTGGPI